MKGKKKFALIGMAAIVALSLLAFGLGTTVFAADDENGDSTTTCETFISKVADKLGLEYDVVSDAMQEARQEMMDEALQERLQEAVDEGLITQEQADEITTWLADRPEALDQLGLGGGQIMGGGRMMGGHHGCGC
ncbi:MAG: hypothetical protein A2Y72_00705 [Chloroflexi bacterium RBG_13_53_26]|nr:MAG: hypothetical protein A2Y72_00705 [Chloroflexi bacterium RBG_13_53_26]